MYFNDGADPWRQEENHIRVFNFDHLDDGGSTASGSPMLLLLFFLVAAFSTRILL